MQPIASDHARWFTTFPHLVTPRDDEWLPGMLLRCDENNHWESKTTLFHLLCDGPEKFHRCWRTETPNLSVISPHSLNLSLLVQLLPMSEQTLLATTYHMELARLYGTPHPSPRLLNPSFLFHVCPQCLLEARLLRRSLLLPNITLCTQHHTILTKQCQCGTLLQLFSRQTQPFTCSTCGMSWAELPQLEASSSQIVLEQKLLAWYKFFFSQGNPPIIRSACQLMIGSTHKRISLDLLIGLLVQRGFSPQGILDWTNRAAQVQEKKTEK